MQSSNWQPLLIREITVLRPCSHCSLCSQARTGARSPPPPPTHPTIKRPRPNTGKGRAHPARLAHGPAPPPPPPPPHTHTQQLKAPDLIPTKMIPGERLRCDTLNGPADGALQLLEILRRNGEAHSNATGSGNQTVV